MTAKQLYLLELKDDAIRTTKIAFDDIFAVRLARDHSDYQMIEIDVKKSENAADDYSLSLEIHQEGWTTHSGQARRPWETLLGRLRPEVAAAAGQGSSYSLLPSARPAAGRP
jgi:hypothetical protein